MHRLVKVATLAFLLLSACGSAEARGDLIPALERLAAANNAEAIYHLGMAYQTGTGLPKDPAKALGAFRRAASLGDVLAAYKLGCYYAGQEGLIETQPELALRYKLVAAEQGYALAQQDVAALYAGKGDVATALTWLEKSASQGWAEGLATTLQSITVPQGSSPTEPRQQPISNCFWKGWKALTRSAGG